MTESRHHNLADPTSCWCQPIHRLGLWMHMDERVPEGFLATLPPDGRVGPPPDNGPEPGTVLLRNRCGHCRRVIEWLAGVGWVHCSATRMEAELPCACEAPTPWQWYCPACKAPRATSAGSDGSRLVDVHTTPGTMARCCGSLAPGVAPPSG